jgi:hypothetical protein
MSSAGIMQRCYFDSAIWLCAGKFLIFVKSPERRTVYQKDKGIARRQGRMPGWKLLFADGKLALRQTAAQSAGQRPLA